MENLVTVCPIKDITVTPRRPLALNNQSKESKHNFRDKIKTKVLN